MRIKRTTVLVVAASLVCLLSPRLSVAGFTGVTLVDVSAELGTPGNLRTVRIFAEFDDPNDQLLAVGAGSRLPLRIELNAGELFNDADSFFFGLKDEDFPTAPIGAAWDSYVTVGSDVFAFDDTDYSPGFAGGDGTSNVIRGSSIYDEFNGWYDSNPDTPSDGGTILIAQFTINPVVTWWIDMEATVYWYPQGNPSIQEHHFYLLGYCPGGPPGDVNGDFQTGFEDLLAILAAWGPCPNGHCPADLDGNGAVAFPDLLLLLVHWGANCNK